MAIQKKTEGRDLEEYLQEVWDSLEPAWDKSKFDMKQGYDSEYECDCITITSKDNEGVRAKIYVNDYEGKHPVGFDVVYRYPGDKGVGVMGSYEFQSTDMDNLGEEVFDYFDEIKKKVGESMKSEAKGSLGELIDKVDNMFHYHNKNLNNYQYNTIDDLLGALKSKDTDKIKEAIRNLDNLVHYRNKNLNNSQYYLLEELLEALQKKYNKSEDKKSERAIPVSGAIKQKINDGITQCLSAIKGAGAVANPIKVTNSTDKPELSTRDTLVYAPSYVYRESGMERNFVGVMFHVEKDGQYGQLFIGWDKKNNRPFVWAGGATFDSYDSFCNDFKHDFSECFKTTESKKSESLTLKQKELKDMARFGQAEDITTISDEEAKALRKKGIETIGISRGTYGMNGALLRDNEGNRYVITARSSNLFYFV